MRANSPMRLYLVAMLLAACSYQQPNSGDDTPDDGPLGDGPLPDAGPCQAVGTAECVGDELRTCVTEGDPPDVTNCGWGCDDSGTPRCKAITPTGGAATVTDLDPATLALQGAVTIPEDSLINTTDGSIDTVLAGFTATPTTPSLTVPDAMVFRFASLTIDAGNIKIEGSRALVLVADGPIVVNGVIETQSCGLGGASVQLAGPGGGTGANDENVAPGPGGGGRALQNGGGGGGGGHGGIGGAGGDAAAGGPAGPVSSDAAITLLIGGGGGGGGRGGGGGLGGGGGAAVQLISNTSITIAATGGINAGGCGGGAGAGGGNDGGAGGGAGGAIVLEAPAITIDGALAVNGGGGGGSDVGGNGSNGTLDRMPAAGGLMGQADGAVGGAGAAAEIFVGTAGTDAVLSSGGGGGIGRMRFNVRTLPQLTVGDQNKLSPNLVDTGSTATAATATFN